MLPLEHLDRIQISFDDHRLVAKILGCSFRPRWACIWACPNWLTGTWTWAMHQAEPTRALRS